MRYRFPSELAARWTVLVVSRIVMQWLFEEAVVLGAAGLDARVAFANIDAMGAKKQRNHVKTVGVNEIIPKE